MTRREVGPTSIESCRYRRVVSEHDGTGAAICALLETVMGAHGREWSIVEPQVCESCLRSSPPSPREPNPVVASLLYSRSTRLASFLGDGDGDGDEADRLRRAAEAARDRLDVLYDEPMAIPSRRPAGPGSPAIAELIPPPSTRHGRRARDWAVGVTTAPRVQPVLGTCLDSLARAGWHGPHLFIDAAVNVPAPHQDLPRTARDERIGAWPNYLLALTELLLRHPRADAYMIVQDDALFHDREPLTPYLEAVLWPGRAPCLVSLYCNTSDTASEPGWHASVAEMRGGPVALVFPRDLAKAFVTDREVFEHRWGPDEVSATSIGDTISSWAHRRGVPVWLPTPSLVQHIGDTSTLWPLARAKGPRIARWFAGGEP